MWKTKENEEGENYELVLELLNTSHSNDFTEVLVLFVIDGGDIQHRGENWAMDVEVDQHIHVLSRSLSILLLYNKLTN